MTEIAAAEALKLAQEISGSDASALLIDVREQQEWDRGHSPLAVHIPMSEFSSRIHEVPTGRRLLIVCRSGARSARVTSALLDAGYDAVNVAGGMIDWNRAGGDLVGDGPEPAGVE